VVFVQVPDVFEQTPHNARQIIQQAGLVAKFTGTGSWVDGQSPQAGHTVPRGTTVTMHLNPHIPP
jgi:beta-lactam-binding protein with PASTA domain